ncbi:MAG TPA: pyridoxamine 5'-phosphate oxidase family protein [Pyrinomonadaceae bacterium]|jgi:nitroimidazol reductase NimA-like FMN-containing flavoprotein (pyridoxamine 5'-phosphate oxidase superfamily)|nr:pyridoxamine 5'-phosphate oxidase family protein [Pyrinomonadaceae bacterium]
MAPKIDEIKQTDRTRVRRIPKRGLYDRESIYAVLDASFICHVGFVVDGQPYVIPTGYARRGDTLLIHGSSASRMLRDLAEGVDVCVTVTILDGLVLARSAFNHSMNYRSAVVLGKATVITGDKEKNEALLALSEHFIRGRWDEVRLPTELELKATTVLSLPIDEASAKVRDGGPVDDHEDYELDVWAGVLPMQMTIGEPIADAKLKDGIEIPSSVKNYRR